MLPRRLRNLPIRSRCGDFVLLEANTWTARLLGLALMRVPPPNVVLHFPGCRSVHTFGMSVPLDVTFLDANAHTIRTVRRVPPGRILFCRSACSVLEMASRR